MVKFVGVEEVKKLIQQEGIENFTKGVMARVKQDFAKWEEFDKSPRHATYLSEGPIELMPVANETYYTFKYVNNHVRNNEKGMISIVGYGALADSVTGYPLMLSEMTLLTAVRTAATCAMAAEYLAKPNAKKFGVVGCGAQSEFQTTMLADTLGLKEVYYYDIDPAAMEKFAANLQTNQFKLIPMPSAASMLEEGVDVLTLCTANATQDPVLQGKLPAGIFINAMGGDAETKTELKRDVLDQADKIFIEYFDQTKDEGDIKCYGEEEAKDKVYAELWELVSGKKPARENNEEIIIYDSVGFALEDYSVLTYVYDKIKDDPSIRTLDLIPELEDLKDLYSTVG